MLFLFDDGNSGVIFVVLRIVFMRHDFVDLILIFGFVFEVVARSYVLLHNFAIGVEFLTSHSVILEFLELLLGFEVVWWKLSCADEFSFFFEVLDPFFKLSGNVIMHFSSLLMNYFISFLVDFIASFCDYGCAVGSLL